MDAGISAPVAANGDFDADAAAFSAFWQSTRDRLGRLPAKPKRDAAAIETAEAAGSWNAKSTFRVSGADFGRAWAEAVVLVALPIP